jgi:DNA-directed RNA polymerase specialized sigma24 family protein
MRFCALGAGGAGAGSTAPPLGWPASPGVWRWIGGGRKPARQGPAPGSPTLPPLRRARNAFSPLRKLARLQVLIAALPPALRHPLQLAGLREFENAEVAAILGISPAAVRRRLMRARQTLREKLLREEMTNEKPAHEPRSNR